MANTVVVGAMWGDESKGKLIDFLAHDKDVVVRWGGGSNAGHTVVVPNEAGGEDEYKLHLVPSGILHPNTLCVVADGVVLDPASFVGELTALKARGVSCENLKISGNVHIVLPYHVLLDELEEKRKGKRALGTTGRGIGPAYQDKAARIGIRMREFVDTPLFAERLSEVLEFKNEVLTKIYGVAPLSAAQILDDLLPHAEALRPYVDDTALRVAYAARSGKKVLFEGAQGGRLGVDSFSQVIMGNPFKPRVQRSQRDYSLPFKSRHATDWQTDDDMPLDSELYCRRLVIEQMNAWLDGFKPLLVRYETCLNN